MLNFGRGSEGELIKPGSLVSGVVESVATKTIVVAVHESSRMKGTVVLEHLADHHGSVEFLITFQINSMFCYALLPHTSEGPMIF